MGQHGLPIGVKTGQIADVFRLFAVDMIKYIKISHQPSPALRSRVSSCGSHSALVSRKKRNFVLLMPFSPYKIIYSQLVIYKG